MLSVSVSTLIADPAAGMQCDQRIIAACLCSASLMFALKKTGSGLCRNSALQSGKNARSQEAENKPPKTWGLYIEKCALVFG